MYARSTQSGMDIRTPDVLDQAATAQRSDGAVGTWIDGDDLYIEAHHAGLDWKFAIRRDGDGQATFQFLGLPPEGTNLSDPVEVEGTTAVNR